MKTVGRLAAAVVAGFFVAASPLSVALAGTATASIDAENSIEAVNVAKEGDGLLVKVTLNKPLSGSLGSFSVANPARIAIDFPGTVNGTGRNAQVFNEGDLRSANIVQAGGRTRLVLNLLRPLAFETRTEDRHVLISLASAPARGAKTPQSARFAEGTPSVVSHSIRDITFRRGKDGEGRVIVDLSDASTGIDIRQIGSNLQIDFQQASLPASLHKRFDVTDFATPVTSLSASSQGRNVRLLVTPKGLWEHNAYQSDNQFVIEVKRVQEDPKKLVQGAGRQKYSGEKLSLNFQNIDVRSVLQVIADFTNFNIITSDSVGGNLTLRLKDVPWDQALDIILQAKGLDLRKNGNVIWIARREELVDRERQEFESKQDIDKLEPLHTETFQINYHKAASVAAFLRNKDQSILTSRGHVTFDDRTNKLFVSDVAARLEEIRRIVSEIDVSVRQVLIEAQIVEASDTFTRNLGVRLGFGGSGGGIIGTSASGNSVGRYSYGSSINQTAYSAGLVETKADLLTQGLGVNLPAGSISSKAAGALSFVLWNSNATRFLALEISALEADGRGKVISRPRVMTTDQVEALIEQGVEIPYTSESGSGGTSVSFKKANLSLKVKPQITPDGKVMMTLDVNKDTPNTKISTNSGIAIDTKHVKTEVLVENGGTIVIGGIYTQETSNVTTKIPFLGDLPVAGYLFRSNQRIDDKTELLVFITPKIVTDQSAAH